MSHWVYCKWRGVGALPRGITPPIFLERGTRMTNAEIVEIKNAQRAAQDLLDASATSPTGIAVEQRVLAAQILAGLK